MAIKKNKNQLPFHARLILNQWMMRRVFGVESFEKLVEGLKDEELEGLDENNTSRFFHALRGRFAHAQRLPADALLRYDENIVRYTIEINRNRGENLRWKYFQYLALLFTEIFLDRWATDEQGLLDDLNWFTHKFNARFPNDALPDFTPRDICKLAFWNATGSGKTLLMHANISQFKHYWKRKFPHRKLDNIILLTPNEGLSTQHLEELKKSGISAELFNKSGNNSFRKNLICVIDIHKLKDEAGEKTVAVESFEGVNLVLVDEGHRGASGEEWKKIREKIAKDGFSFEYSATFGQAVKAAKKDELTEEYAKAILFDYSYKFFYFDGYGKEYRILNLPDKVAEESRLEYLTACLLSYYQQLRIYQEKNDEIKPFLLAKPLLVFVGGSVTKTTSSKDVADVVDILVFFAKFIGNPTESISRIDKLLSGKTTLLEGTHNVFATAFNYLIENRANPDEIFRDILDRFFNAKSAASLHIENLAKVDGEIAISVGDNAPFGVINVGDDKKLCKLCEGQTNFVVKQKDFAKSLFNEVNKEDSRINLVVGSRKFSEGWNSWRVSTMGLMNIGKTEGSQIIQLFGRGVRLKGHHFSLQRSRFLTLEKPAPKFLDSLETLNIFGLKADYMTQFKEYLEEEGLPVSEQIEIVLPTITLDLWEKKNLKIIRVKEGKEFANVSASLQFEPPKAVVKIDAYPKLQAMSSSAIKVDDGSKQVSYLEAKQLAFINFDEIFLELQQYKMLKGWHNFSLNQTEIRRILLEKTWYELLIPKNELEQAKSFDSPRHWQELALSLLKKYCEQFYKHKKDEYEKPFYEYRDLTADDPNFIKEYKITIEKSRTDFIAKLQNLSEIIESKKLLKNKTWNYSALTAIGFNAHLYFPLLALEKSGDIKISPVSLNEGEREFVIDLQKYCEQNKDKFEFGKREIYLLRNQSKGKGVGFFEAGNFHPDFILWLIVDDKQFVSFIDPKGVRNLDGKADPKLNFYQAIKTIEKDLHQQNAEITLNSFIVSNTLLQEINWRDNWTKYDFGKRNVLFQIEDKDTYIEQIFDKITDL